MKLTDTNKINIDVSEVKSFRECTRKWAFSSRNKMHLRAKEQKLPLRMGTAFHKALERMYLGTYIKLDDIVEELEIDEQNAKMMELNLGGYYNNVLKHDLEKFAVVNTEHRFNIPLLTLTPELCSDGSYNAANITGSIDLVFRDRQTGKYGGLEHKYIRNFRPDVYEHLDEQPKMYFYALEHDFDDCEVIGINQIRKLKTKFDHARTHMSYTPKQLENFIENFTATCIKIVHSSLQIKSFPARPGYMSCQICDYAPLCLYMNELGTDNISVLDDKELLGEYGFEKRLIDHLDEK